MKKKGLFAVVIALFSLVATLGYVNSHEDVSYTEAEVSTWDGTSNAASDIDYVNDATNKILYIYTANGLAYYANIINSGYNSFDNYTISLENDIDLNNNSWTPICKDENYGKTIRFEGNYHTINNLNVSGNMNYYGLFGYVVGGEVKNLCISNAFIQGKSNVGAIIGKTNSSGGVVLQNVKLMDDCSLSLLSNNGYLGSLVGYAYGKLEIKDSKSTASVFASNSLASLGGLVGYAESSTLTINSCAFDGVVETNAKYSGGIAGMFTSTADCTISNVYSTANFPTISNSTYVGGLFGYVRSFDGAITISNAYNYFCDDSNIVSGDVDIYIGGLFGYVAEGSYTFNNLYQIGKVFGNQDVLDWNITGRHANLYYKASRANIAGSSVSSFNDYKIKYNYKNFDYDNVWKFSNYNNVNYGLPVLKSVEYSGFSNSQSSMSVSGQLSGKGGLKNPYLIKTAGDLAFLSLEFNKSSISDSYSGKYFVLLNDIDLTGKTWIPIGNNSAFNGVFDGFGHSIKGISSSMQERFFQFGLFGKIGGATIKNLTVKEVMFLSNGSSGAIAGKVSSKSYFINCLADQVALPENSSNAQIIYGEDNLKNAEWSTNLGTAAGYEIEVVPNGGNFYTADTPSKVEKLEGEYKVIISPKDSSVEIKDLSAFDAFYKTDIPTDTTVDANKSTSYAIEVGNKLNGLYSLAQGGEKLFDDEGNLNSGITLDSFGNLSKIYAQWETSVIKSVKFDLNPYERNYFGVTGEKARIFSVSYNSSLEDIWEGPIAERAGFTPKIYTLYSDGLFSSELTNKNIWINKNLQYYIKWLSDNTTTFTLTLNMQKTSALGAGSFEFDDAINGINGVSLNGSDGTPISAANVSNGVYTFNVKTTYSTLTSNYLSLNISFKNGFIGTINNVDRPTDDYGVLQIDAVAEDFEGNKEIKILNLDENYSLYVVVKRKEYTSSVSYDGHFALAPLQEIDSNTVVIPFGSSGWDSSKTYNVYQAGIANYLGFDFIDKAVVSTRDAVDIGSDLYKVVEGYLNFDINTPVFLKFKKGSEETVYKYALESKTDNGDYYVYTYNLTRNENDVDVDLLVQLKVTENKDTGELAYDLVYYQNASFAVIFAVGDKAGDEGAEYANYSTNLETRKTDDRTLKLYGEFENIDNSINTIVATKQNIKILLDYKFVDEEGNEISNCDVKYSGKSLCDVVSESQLEDGNITFTFTNGKLYKLDNVKFYEGDNELVPDSQGGQKIKSISIDNNNFEVSIKYLSALTAGKYTIKLICNKQEYTLACVAVKQDLTTEIQHGNDKDIKSVSATAVEFNYDTTNVMATTEQNNYLHSFVGWALKKGTTVVYFVNNMSDSSDNKIHTLSNIDMSYVYENSDNANFVFTIYAVYAEKTYKTVSGDSALLVDSSNNISLLEDPLLFFNVGNKTPIVVDKKGVNSNAYYSAGIRVKLGEVNAYEEKSYGKETLSFDIDSALVDYIKNNEIDSLVVNYVVYPIFAKKTLEVTIKSTNEILDADQYIYDDSQPQQQTNDFTLSFNKTLDEVIDLSNVSGVDNKGAQINNISMNSKFASRKGYSVSGWKYALNETVYDVESDSIPVTVSMFSSGSLSSEIVIYRVWTAKRYTVTIDANGGYVSNYQTITFTTKYQGTEFGENIGYGRTDFARYGYDFAGLYHGDVCVYNAGFEIQNDNGVVSPLGKYLLDENVTLSAHWSPAKKSIKVFANGSESGLISDLIFNEDYDSQTAIGNVVSEIAAKNPQREGFVYNGLKYVSSDRAVDISETFNSSLSEFKMAPETGEANLAMYVDWRYENYHTFTLSENFVNTKETVYSGQNQEYSIAEYLFVGNQTLFTQTGYTISYNGSKLSIVAKGNVETIVSMTFEGEELQEDSEFVVKNVGNYRATLSVSVSDLAEYGNKGEISDFEVSVYVYVEKADVQVSVSQEIKLCNVKQILKNFLSDEKLASLNDCDNFEEFATFIKTVEPSLEEKSNDEIYEYIIAKYTLLIEENDFKKFKEFNYDSFVEYKTENVEKVENILNRMKFFTFYDFENNKESENIFATYFNCFGFDSDATQQIFARSVSVLDYGFGVIPRNSYVYRLYISSVDLAELSNFNLNYENGNAYFDISSVYILPQIMRVENTSDTTKTYYKSGSVADIEWYKDIASKITVSGGTFYKIANNIFMQGKLVTSNDGDKAVDTVYTTFSEENYLYFTDVRIMVFGEESYIERTSFFTILPEQNEQYTIANINNVATINISAKYLTKGNYSFEFKDLPANLGTNLLKITGIRYKEGGQTRTIYNEQGLDIQNYDSFEIVSNNSNLVTIFTTEAVESFTVSTDSLVLDPNEDGYIRLYKWTTEESYSVDGTMETDGAHEFDLSNIEFGQDDVSEIDLYAVYTDLVLIRYVYDFPSTYQYYSIDTDCLKLGSSTIDDFIMPQEGGFKLKSLKYRNLAGTSLLSYENLFVDGVFKGINPSEPHTMISLYSEWEIEDFEYVQETNEIKRSASRLYVVGNDDIVTITNKNENLYSYTYEWKKGNVLLSNEESLVFMDGGKVSDSGEYTLKIIATISEDFRGKVAQDTNELELTFNITLYAPKIIATAFNGENEVVYNSRDRQIDWYVDVTTYEYNDEIGDYDDEPFVQKLYSSSAGLIWFEITKDSSLVNEMKNAGVYRIELAYSTEDFVCESGVNTIFNYTITPYEFDMSAVEIAESKKFNAAEETLEVSVNTGFEGVTIKLERESGEDVGEYDIFVASDLEEVCYNYVFKYENVEVWRNGVSNTNVAVGTFEITPANTLKVYYEVDAQNPQNISYEYNLNGFTLSLSDNFVLSIKSNNVTQKSLNLVLFDTERGEIVSNPDVLNILRYYANDLTVKFFNVDAVSLAKESGSYTYKFECGTEFSKRFVNVEFEKGYQFTIEKVQININSLQADKVYDGSEFIYFDLAGNRISSTAGRDVYIIGKYDSKHVGQDIKVEFDFGFGEGTVNANYQFSAKSTLADITKKTVSATVSLTDNQFVYGEISTYNFENYIGEISLEAGGQDCTSMLEEGYYSVSYALPSGILEGEAGLICVGTYTIDATYSFADFEISDFEVEQFTVSVLDVERNLVEGMFRVIVGSENANGPFSETFKIFTGDALNLSYSSATAGTLEVGHYNVVLDQTLFVNNSVRVTINAQNQALYVISSDEVVYMSVQDETIFTHTYNATAYEISVNLLNKQIVVSNGENEFASSFTLKEVGHSEEIDITNVSSLSIHYLQDTTTFTNAGIYRLGISYVSNRYPNIVFDKNYEFVVEKIVIDETNLNITKVYDNSTNLDIFEFDEKIELDNVYITARFENGLVGQNKNVSLVLSGTESANYEIAGTATGNITKAQAVVTLAKDEFVYGQFSQTDKLLPVVMCGEQKVSTYQYTINFTIQGATYGDNVWKYLNVGTYNILMEGSSDNYNLVFENAEIVVSSYSFDVVFETSGMITAQYGSAESKTNTFETTYNTPLFEDVLLTVTRESGSMLGYYKALSAVCDNENYIINSVSDTSDGVYRIVKSNEIIYVLLVDENGQIVDTVYAQYNAAEYNSIVLVEEEGEYSLKISSEVESKVAKLKTFKYNDQTAEYEEFDGEIENLAATFSFVGNNIKDVGTYTYHADSTNSTNYQIRFEKYGEISNKFVITKRNLYFKEAELSKVFDNNSAIFELEDAKELLEGILESDNFGLRYSFYDGLVIAKYVNNNAHYRVEAELIDENDLSVNYVLNITTADGAEVYGVINGAKALIYINSRAGTYGDTINLSLRYELKVDDLTNYDTTNIVVESSIKNPEYSTAGKLKAGVYEIECNYAFDDFVPVFVVDGREYEEYSGQATVRIEQKLLTLSAVSGEIKDVFTKTYDQTTNCVIEVDGQKLLQFEGLLAGDEVTLDSAVYESAKIGSSIRVDFVLGGEDNECYRIESWPYGIITPIIVGISFNYNVADTTGIERLPIGYQNLTALAYPLLSTSSLTTNSNDQLTSKTANFPTSLYGREGYKFVGWDMVFDGVTEGSAKETFITQLAQNCGIEYTLDDGLFKARVANNTPTVKFIDGLIGYDTENLFGLYYKENNNIQIEFVANWGIQTYKISIAVTDKNGVVSQYGKFEIDGVEYTQPVNGREFEYGSTLTITTTAYEHCSFIGLYNNRRLVTDGEIPYYIDGNNIVITISSISKSYDLEMRFNVQNVNVVFDLTNYDNSTISNVEFTKSGSVYTMTKDYLSLKNITLSDVGLSRVGYILRSITANGQTVLAADFATTSLTEFVSTIVDETVNFVPGFEPVGILVNLDYGFDSRVDVISVDYGRTYADSIDWIEEPIRTGHDFAGWYNQNNVLVTGETVVENLQEHTLTAHWTLADFNLVVEAENAKIYVDENLIERIETTVKYQQAYAFKIVADEGYLIDSTAVYPTGIVVTLSDEKTANVMVTMPGNNLTYTFVAKADENTLTFAGERLQKIEVFEVGQTETEITVSQNAAVVETGKKYKIVVTANDGYDMSEIVEISVDYLTIEKSVSEGVLTIFVEGVKENVEFTFYTQEGLNTVEVNFDEDDKILYMVAGDRRYTEFSNISFNIYTDATFEMYVVYKGGYKYKDYTSAEGIVATATRTIYQDVEAYRIVLSDVKNGSITINTEFKKFTLKVEVVSYDSAGNEITEQANRAFIKLSGINYEEISLDYLSQVALRAEAGQSYSFAGWSKNKADIFDSETQTNYIITKDERLYAIFSAVKFEVTLATIDRKVTYIEYNDPERLKIEYNILTNAGEKYYEDENLTQEISQLSIYYGSSKRIFYSEPEGYNIIAFGHFVGDEFVLISEVDNRYSVPSFTISTTEDYMDVEQTEKTIYAVVSAKTLRVEVSTKIFYENTLEENENVGTVKLVTEDGEDVNEYGYVDGTRVRYSNYSEVDFKNYTFIACTTDEVYLKVETLRDGYKFYGLSVDGESIFVELVDEEENCSIYRLSGLVGGKDFEVTAFFKPLLNKIVVDYLYDEEFVDAGALNITLEGNNSYKVFTSGSGKSMIEISAYTDSKFKVVSYINLGYLIEPDSITLVDENGIVLSGSVRYKEMSIENTGYNCAIEFEVEGYLGDNEISIVVVPRKFTVKFVEDEQTLVLVKNVEYGKAIDLSQANSANIEIVGNGIGFKDEKLNLVFARQNYNYQGFFTYENGAGVRYIDAEGEVLQEWTESGYIRNNLTSKYEIATNTKVNEETGEFEVSLYIYWSYLKTRITFEFTPTLTSIVTAKDLIKGADYTNSWYYDAAPNYIEISYNTRISISAPEIEGYKFYQFVISQKDANGEELADVVTYSNDIPWETNELDNIVEVKVKVVYFAKIDVVVEGGEGSFEIEQDYENSQAKALLDENYIDTTKAFKLSALPNEGYEFVSWYNIETGKRSWAENGVWDNAKAEVASIFILTLKGKQITLSFKDEDGDLYDTTYGQIYTAKIESLTGNRTEILAKTNNGTFTVLKDHFDVIVGDKITLNMAVTFGFGVIWNIDDVKYSSFENDRYEFTFDIVGSMSEEDILRVLPEFKNTILSIFIERDFVSEDKGKNAVDFDNVNMAGNIIYENEKTDLIYADRDKDVSMKLLTNARYSVSSITLINGQNTIELEVDGENIVLTKDFVEENEIIGVVKLKIIFTRKLWENSQGSDSLTGNGENSPYLINSLEDLVLMMKNVNNGVKNSNGIYYANASYILNCDINLSEQFWTPIGNYANAFNGKFNFNGHIVSSIYNPYFYDEISYNGLFGVLGKDAEIISNSASVWYWYLSGGVALALIGSITTIVVVSRKRKKQREKMSSK